MSANTKMWFDLDGAAAAKELVGYVRELDQSQRGARVTNLRNLRLYTSLESAIGASFRQNMVTAGYAPYMGRKGVTLNVVKSCVDTLIAKVTKQDINPMFLTSDASYESEAKSKKLTAWNRGLFQSQNVYKTNAMVARDAGIFDKGIVKVYAERDAKAKKGKVVFERIFPDEILVDAVDAYYGKPSMLYQTRVVSKSVLKAMFPKHAIAIENAATERFAGGVSRVASCLVVEAWKLPGADGKDGKHMLAIETAMLSEDVYEKDRFPFAFLYFTNPILGFSGYSVCDELVGLQLEINRLLQHIQQAMRLLANPRVFVDMASKVNENQLTNEIGGIVYFAGSPPVVQAAATVHPELFQHLDRLYSRAFEIVGISAMSAQSRNILGANASGSAIREFHDIETERFAVFAKAYEDLHTEEAKLAVEVAQDLAADGYSVEVVTRDRKTGAQKLDWKELDYDRDDFVIECFPVSSLPQEPSARKQEVMEMQQMGWIDPEEAQDLADLPDVASDRRLATAPRRWIRMQLEKMIETNTYIPPEPYQNLEQAQVLAMRYLADAELRGAPEETKALLREFIDDCAATKAPPAAAASAAAPLSPAMAAQGAQLAAPVAGMADPAALMPGIV